VGGPLLLVGGDMLIMLCPLPRLSRKVLSAILINSGRLQSGWPGIYGEGCSAARAAEQRSSPRLHLQYTMPGNLSSDLRPTGRLRPPRFYLPVPATSPEAGAVALSLKVDGERIPARLWPRSKSAQVQVAVARWRESLI